MPTTYCPDCGGSKCVLPSDSESVPLLERGRLDFYCLDCAVPFRRRVSFSAMWTDKLGEEINRRSISPYPIECHLGEDFESLSNAINQGIDSRLEAIFFKHSIGNYGRQRVVIEPKSVSVLVRRLMESGSAPAELLASSICGTLGIEVI